MEEAQKQKREAVRKERVDRVSKPEEKRQRKGNPGQFSHHVPLMIARDRKGDYALPSIPGPSQANKRPRLPPWTSRQPESSARGGDVRRNLRSELGRRREPEPERKKNSPLAMGVIKTISGGSTDGDSNRARKSKSRRDCMEVEGMRRNEAVISFRPEDLKGVNLPHNDALVIQAWVANYDVMRDFIDSDSSVKVIFKESLIQMDLQGYHLEAVETALFGFAGHVVYPEGEIVLPLTLGSQNLKKTLMTSFIVVDSPSSYNIILGRPAMNELRAVVSTYYQKIKFPVGARVGEVRGDQPSSRKCYVEAVRADQSKTKREGKKAKVDEVGGRVVEKGEVHFVAEEEQEVVEIGPGQQIRVARYLSASTWVSLINCIKTNIHAFSWSQQELTGISPLISEHHLNILSRSHPVKQKKRHFGLEKDKVIDEQVRDLLKAGHIREIEFPTWLSNVVLVPKSNEKWWMCVDFRDLNKACPKDHYPLPRIHQLVDSTPGFELQSFMDAYQGYHQIPLAKSDQDKASFITSRGTFCYVVMHFGLKNAGATYQRLMNKVFEKKLGQIVEVYGDDTLGKSKEVADFITDLEETFVTLRHYGIKLNPAKCILGVKSGKFFGFIVTDRGIEVNQEKVKSVLCMSSPRFVKEVQKLIGRIASLSRFISQSAHMSYLFFQVLRKAQQFGWDEKCEQAFQDLKIHLEELPVFVKPEPGEKLFVYLSTTEYAISSVLIKEEGSDQKPVYYFSHALRGPELRYSEIEKIPLALIMTAQKLRPYFLSHQIIVLTNSHLGRIMTHSEVSGRMIKWTVELGEYDIEYKPRVAIKAQALSDFLSEMVQSEEEELITQLIKGVYEAKDDRMLKYLQLIQAQAKIFVDWSIKQIPREENGEADALAKMTASLSEVSTREVLHVSRLVLSTEKEALSTLENSRMTPLVKFIVNNELPEDKARAQKIKRQAPRFVLLNNVLYRRSFQRPLLKCLSEGEVDYVLREIHEGCCAEHLGGNIFGPEDNACRVLVANS
ncbi:uncharacterized protein LOC142523882 [Primulina tabacum]|uniref:uncharacterized protein LOC142523882 n=1 Tax=Primulina tabacum TaxID=48773 RepID=UPI003F5A7A72